MERFISSFKNSLQTGFLDKDIESELLYQPELLVNSKDPKKKILSTIKWELETCKSFFISVAFVTTGGVATIIETLKDLENRNIPGKLVVSQYLNFTEPEALKRLLQFKNIELRIATNVNAHSKGYLFKKENHFNLIIGSSNLTQNALSDNKEWNLKVSATDHSKIIEKVYNEFDSDFESATIVTNEYIAEYEKIYKSKQIVFKNVEESLQQETILSPNKMQSEALQNLENIRRENKSKALIISATGTGKTYLSAFDAKAFKAKKLLFVVHRLNIAKKAMESFKKVFGNTKSMGIYSGKQKETDKDFLFSTVQTISKDSHLKVFDPGIFDYIIIDESHRSGADSYINLLNYFAPKFLLGMTATPERTDGSDIFKLFDHNIAYEIRLNNAMEADLLCPFHYYGVSDIKIDEVEQDDFKIFNKLTSDERVEKIIKTSKFYGTDNGICCGLVFTSGKNESRILSDKFNEKGFRTIALDGESSEELREVSIKKLENNQLDYIFTVDIFNEGIDIPKVNQIIMLRPTESAIIFVQQLGRGLRKTDAKSYLTVIDFIGNHKNNYLIPIALYGDSSFNKDKIRRLLSDGSTELPGASTINFDKIAKEKIFEAINSANMRLLRDLKKDYFLLKYRLGRTPMMMDFIEANLRDPFTFVEYSKSYYNFVLRVDDEFEGDLSKEEAKLLELFSTEINNGKRVEESIILRELLNKNELKFSELKNIISLEYEYEMSDSTFDSLILNLNFEFIKNKKNILIIENSTIKFHPEFLAISKIISLRSFLLDSINYSITTFSNKFSKDRFKDGFILHQKYNRKDVCRILNWEKDLSSTVYGYRTNKSSTPCFVTYHKSDTVEDSINYNDHFISPSIFAWESRSNRKIESPEIQNVINSKRILLFIKKADSEGIGFYYMGDVTIVPDSTIQAKMPETGQPVVHFNFKLSHPVPNSLYNYITDKNTDLETKTQADTKVVEMKIEKPIHKIPLYNLYAAAGSFSEMQTEKDYSLIEVPEKYSDKRFFAIKVVGESMNRRIPNGSICVFKQPVEGSRNGKILLIQWQDRQDPDLQSHFTVKTYISSKTINEEGWKHNSIVLKPNSLDDTYEDIVITEDDLKYNRISIIGEFVDVIEK